MNFKKIKTIQWYRQQTEGTPYFIYLPCLGCLNWFKNKGQIIWLCNLEEARAYLDKSLLRKLAEEYLAKEKAKPGNLQKMYQAWVKEIKQVNTGIYQSIVRKDLRKVSDTELLAINQKLANQSFIMWTKFFMDIYDVDAEGLIERELVNQGKNLTSEERNVMMQQNQLLALQREERDLLKIAQLVKKTASASGTFLYISAPSNLHRLKQYPLIAKALDEHQQSYFWLRNSWAHSSVMTIFDFVEVIKQVLFSSRKINQELKKLENFAKDLKTQKKKIADKYQMSAWLRKMFDFFGLLAFWRDERKTELQKLNHYLEAVGSEIARRSGLSWNELKVCDPLAIKAMPVKKQLVEKYKKLLKDQYLIVWNGRRTIHLSKQESQKMEKALEATFQTKMTEIRGMIACPGKIKGEVIVINKKSEFAKMQPGKVLVTNMTRPDFVPLMKKAIAIVTDEGGITSHAAVVSREMKIPCVIGTQVASKMLKDGDQVFVNADHGVVIVQ